MRMRAANVESIVHLIWCFAFVCATMFFTGCGGRDSQSNSSTTSDAVQTSDKDSDEKNAEEKDSKDRDAEESTELYMKFKNLTAFQSGEA